MERLTLFVDVIVPLAVPNKYTYRVPHEFNDTIEIGKRVIIPFGKAKLYTGIIYTIHQTPPKHYEAKYIQDVLDDVPIVNAIQLQFWDWIAYYYMCNIGDVMNAALPSGLKLSSTSSIVLNPDFNLEEVDLDYFTEKEHTILEALHHQTSLKIEDIVSLIQIKTVQPIINSLLKKKAIIIYEEIKEKYKPKLIPYITLSDQHKEDESLLKTTITSLEKKAFRQAEVLLLFLHLYKTSDSGKQTGWVKKSDLLKQFDGSTIKSLVTKHVFIEQEFETSRLLFNHTQKSVHQLNPSQEIVFRKINELFIEKDVILFHGITGSGKTEIYCELIKEVLKKKQQVLFLVPEIALTTQLINRIKSYFGDIVGVYHSKFSENERVEIWNSILSNSPSSYQIILGPRSALFLPFNNLGLIVVDEEHDNSYKQQDPSPRYHARDAAIYLAKQHKAKVLLGSATPSLESYYNAQTGKYGLIKLTERFGKASLPELIVCDVKEEKQKGLTKSIFSHQLIDAITHALSKKEQIILFQNRRGFAPYTECHNCSWTPHCVQCDVSLIYHKQHQKLVCHYCGYSIQPPKSCNACGSNDLRYKGFGTEKIEEDVDILFPTAKVARMDLDTTRSKYAYKQLIDDFENEQIDILIGTQMVTKGLDFDNVSVVGILNIDSSINFPDFRSFEKAYQLITQVSGRAGRKKTKGRVFIQSNQPNHPVIINSIEGTIDEYYNQLLQEREQYTYPPFGRIIELKLVSKEASIVNESSHYLAEELKKLFGKCVLGPEFPLVAKIKNQYYKQILLKLPKDYSIKKIREVLHLEFEKLHLHYKANTFRLHINVDPY